SAAAVVAAFVWFSCGWREPGLVGLCAALLGAVPAGVVRVSCFGFACFKQFDMDRRIKGVYLIIVPLFFMLIASDPSTMLLSMFATYAASAPVLWAGRRIRRAMRGTPASPGSGS